MSFSIKLYQNKSPVNFVSKNIEELITVNGYLRSGASVLDPSVIIESPLTDADTILSTINYAQIEVYGRYYYVTNVYVSTTGLWTIDMHVDVLMSYAQQIREQTAVVARQENVYNLYLDDGSFMSYQNPRIQTKYFDVVDPFESEEYVLVVAGSGPTEVTPDT